MSLSPTSNTNSPSTSLQRAEDQHHSAGGSLTLVKRLHSLASDVENQAVVARRGVLPSLLLFLQSSDPTVRHVAAETLVLLSSHPENPECMCRERGLVRIVVATYRASAANGDEELHRLCSTLVRNLGPALENTIHCNNNNNHTSSPAGGASGQCSPDNHDHHYQQQQHGDADIARRAAASARVRNSDNFGAPTVSVSVQLLVDELTSDSSAVREEKTKALVDCLHTMRGVVSYSLDAQYVTVFLNCTTRHLLDVLKKECGFEHVQVLAECDIMNQHQQEEQQRQQTQESRALSVGRRNQVMDSFPAAESSARRSAIASGPASDYKRSLMIHTTGATSPSAGASSASAEMAAAMQSNSLAARIQRARIREEKPEPSSLVRSIWSFVKTVLW